MAKITVLAAGLLLSLALAGPGQAAPDARPGIAAKTAPDAAANAEPKPRPEPQAVRPAAAPGKQAAAKKPPPPRHPPRPIARRSAPHRALARARRESRQARMDYDERRDREYRPHSGPVYDSAPGGCDEACRYSQWFERYAAWYDRYGRSFSAPNRGSAGAPANIQARPAPNRIYRPDQSERDRLDPWHGYNGRDGLGNGY
jgi:hypothetical protein